MKRNVTLHHLRMKYDKSVQEVKKKKNINSLHSYFSKGDKGKKWRTVSSPDNHYESHWFAFKHLMFILDFAFKMIFDVHFKKAALCILCTSNYLLLNFLKN